MTFSEEIKAYARSLGFDACGICRAEESGEEARYMAWLSEECHAGMSYLERNIEKRLDPRLLVDGAKSIISVALNYFPHRFRHEDAPRFAYYAYGEDYHDVVKKKLSRLLEFIAHIEQQVDDACILDKPQFPAKHLVIGADSESGRPFRMDGLSVIIHICGHFGYIFRGELEWGINSQPFTDELVQLKIEIGEKFNSLFVERVQFVGIIFEEGGGVVCRNDRIPVQVSPVAMVGNADILHPAVCG
jgi:hypothetical protein